MANFGLIKRFLGGSDRREQPRRSGPRGALALVVDDSATIRAVLGKMLSQDGYAVIKAGDGEAAIRMAREQLPDLIFLDIVLPGMNGFAVLRALRREARTKAIPIVMISGNLQATEQFYVQRFGADDFMKKPFGRGEVFERIRRLLESGRLIVRDPQRLAADTPVQPAADHAADGIPDVAMPDPAHLTGHAAGTALPPYRQQPTHSAPEAHAPAPAVSAAEAISAGNTGSGGTPAQTPARDRSAAEAAPHAALEVRPALDEAGKPTSYRHWSDL